MSTDSILLIIVSFLCLYQYIQWYNEKRRRIVAEAAKEVAQRMQVASDYRKELEKSKAAYDEAQGELFGIAPDMLEHLGKPLPPDTGPAGSAGNAKVDTSIPTITPDGVFREVR